MTSPSPLVTQDKPSLWQRIGAALPRIAAALGHPEAYEMQQQNLSRQRQASMDALNAQNVQSEIASREALRRQQEEEFQLRKAEMAKPTYQQFGTEVYQKTPTGLVHATTQEPLANVPSPAFPAIPPSVSQAPIPASPEAPPEVMPGLPAMAALPQPKPTSVPVRIDVMGKHSFTNRVQDADGNWWMENRDAQGNLINRIPTAMPTALMPTTSTVTSTDNFGTTTTSTRKSQKGAPTASTSAQPSAPPRTGLQVNPQIKALADQKEQDPNFQVPAKAVAAVTQELQRRGSTITNVPAATRYKIESNLASVDKTIEILQRIEQNKDMFNSLVTSGKLDVAQTHPVMSRLIPGMQLSPQEAQMAGDLQSLKEHINTLRAPLGATGFRGKEAWDALQAQAANVLQQPMVSSQTRQNSIAILQRLRDASMGILGKKSAGGQGEANVIMVGPDGKPWNVPASKVDIFKQNGYTPKM